MIHTFLSHSRSKYVDMDIDLDDWHKLHSEDGNMLFCYWLFYVDGDVKTTIIVKSLNKNKYPELSSMM